MGWLIITEESKEVKQSIVVKSRLPTEDLRRLWREGKKVTSFTCSKGKWVIIAEPCPVRLGQRFYASNNGFPVNKIKDFYAQKFRIHTLCYTEEEDTWALIVEPTHNEPIQRVHYSSQFPEQQLRRLGFRSSIL
eukprot:TRINITY_DN6460_c0_g1_i2.p1 TRINITY_DN6460_c0_g1~~TRINITY_DN6460_c0_g1_i2.p1  ORF type:complete len:134 (+),score=17.68 TRINITY_DN6460_c0_g1_i2:85-486(+)